jgi:hypothetical protein
MSSSSPLPSHAINGASPGVGGAKDLLHDVERGNTSWEETMGFLKITEYRYTRFALDPATGRWAMIRQVPLVPHATKLTIQRLERPEMGFCSSRRQWSRCWYESTETGTHGREHYRYRSQVCFRSTCRRGPSPILRVPDRFNLTLVN